MGKRDDVSEVVIMLELTTRSRRAARTRRTIVRSAGFFLGLIALSFLLPAAAGLSFHTVTDHAMSGTMGKGSAVIVDSQPVADLEVGDVITYPRASSTGGSSTLITRRIAQVDGGVLRTSGDATDAVDPWSVTLEESRQDVVIGHLPYAGYVVDVLDGAVRFWLAGLLGLLIAITALTGVLTARRDRRREASALAGPAPVVDQGADNMLVPAPRQSGDTRRGSIV